MNNNSAWTQGGAGFRWLNGAEINKLFDAAQAGENPRRDMIILAAVLYLGLDIKDAVKVRYCTACGDAIENRKRGAFLHIPNEYRRIVSEAAAGGFQLKDRLTDSTPEEAEEAINTTFSRAGLVNVNTVNQLRRTAARLHYVNMWTREEELKRYFPEVAEARPEENGVLFYREQTEAEEQAALDAAIMAMPPIIG